MQETRVRSLVWEAPMWQEATKPVRYNYWACALETKSYNYRAHVLQLLKPTCPRTCALQQEKTPQWEDQALQLESSPHLLQLQKRHTHTHTHIHTATAGPVAAKWENHGEGLWGRVGTSTRGWGREQLEQGPSQGQGPCRHGQPLWGPGHPEYHSKRSWRCPLGTPGGPCQGSSPRLPAPGASPEQFPN